MLNIKCQINPKWLWLFKLLSIHLYAFPEDLDNEIRQLLDCEEWEKADILIERGRKDWGDNSITELRTLCDFLKYDL